MGYGIKKLYKSTCLNFGVFVVVVFFVFAFVLKVLFTLLFWIYTGQYNICFTSLRVWQWQGQLLTLSPAPHLSYRSLVQSLCCPIVMEITFGPSTNCMHQVGTLLRFRSNYPEKTEKDQKVSDWTQTKICHCILKPLIVTVDARFHEGKI